MRKWEIKLDKKAEKMVYKLPANVQESILNYLYNQVLELEHPKLLGKALSGNKKGLWRYRVDKFRIICRIHEDKLVVLVISIAKRDVVYAD